MEKGGGVMSWLWDQRAGRSDRRTGRRECGILGHEVRAINNKRSKQHSH
jgi:hypothetical protein